jgi:hypothetical protein
MKKKVLALALILVMALTVGLVACSGGGKDATATYGEVGTEKHSYFPYATVAVNGKGEITSVELGEAFAPAGKIWAEQADTGVLTYAYNNPWHVGAKALLTAANQAKTTAEKTVLLESNPQYCSIDGKIFQLEVSRQVYGNVRLEAFVFVEKSTANNKIYLTDKYLAEHIEWYVNAIKANTVFACNATGIKLEGAAGTPADGAYLKQDPDSTYRAAYYLGGENFKTAMTSLAAFLKEKQCKIEFVVKTGEANAVITGNWANVRVKDWEPAVVTGATATYFQYGASYAQMAVKAYSYAVAKSHA